MSTHTIARTFTLDDGDALDRAQEQALDAKELAAVLCSMARRLVTATEAAVRESPAQNPDADGATVAGALAALEAATATLKLLDTLEDALWDANAALGVRGFAETLDDLPI